MIDNDRFKQIVESVTTHTNSSMGIGTYMEKTIHKVLKLYYEPDIDYHEVRIDNFVADIYRNGNIIEIQTGNFNKMRAKLEYFLKDYTVTIVYPIPYTKWLNWIDENTKEIVSTRKSPKRGNEYLAFKELYKIKSYLTHPNLKLKLVLIDMNEYRLLNGWSKDKKKGSVRYDRVPIKIESEMLIECLDDYLSLVPYTLPEVFTTKDYAKSTKLTINRATTAVNILHYVGAINRIGKKGNAFLYSANEKR